MKTPTRDPSTAAFRAGLGPQTHCYVHPERRSVAVCAVCRRGVCRLCHETVKGKDFCTQDAELLEGEEPPTVRLKEKKPAAPITPLGIPCQDHPGRAAVGICAICKRGVCVSCRVLIKGKSFCRADAEILQKNEHLTRSLLIGRGTIRAASGLDFVDGVAGAVLGFLLLILGLIGPQAKTSATIAAELQPFFATFEKVLTYPASLALAIGLFAFMLGVVDMMAGILLFGHSRVAGVISILVSTLWILMIANYPIIFAVAGVFTYGILALVLVKIGLIVVGWNELGQR